MQNTRLTNLANSIFGQFNRWIQNPWRRISVIIISLLFGNFLATVLSTVAGQEADLDVAASMFLILFTEFISWIVYRGSAVRDTQRNPLRTAENQLLVARPLLLELLNGIKLGLTYGLFVEAFKLGS
ncbi:MAG: DUF565 domain-containing protein [Elainellaceae cyanobacterium]